MNNPTNTAVPEPARGHLEQGRRLQAARDLAGALREYQEAARLAPNNEAILAALGALAMDAGDWNASERIHRMLVETFSGRHMPRLALTLFNLKRYQEALPILTALVEHGDTDLSCVLAYAACLERTGSEQESVDILEKVYAAIPNDESAMRLTSAWMRMSRHDLLEARLPALLAAHPGNAQLLSAMSEHALTCGDYARGFDLMHNRWAIALDQRKSTQVDCPAWDGKPFAGTLLVSAEQGLGDEILSSSVFEELVRIGQRSLVDCEPRLLPVFRRSFPALAFCDRKGQELVNAARAGNCRKVEAIELGRFFRRDPAAFPSRPAWLVADRTRRDALRARLERQFPGKRLVGLSWRSANVYLGDAKSIPLPELAPLLRLPDTVFIDLQYGDTNPDRAALAAATGLTVHHLDDIDTTQDVDGMFALVDALDCVVSSSNTTVHVGGALGKPVFAMIPGTRYSLWYWGLQGERTPWYPTVRLFRGPATKPWPALAQDVADAIARTVTGGDAQP